MMRTWWQAREPREQKLLAGGAVLAAVLLAWALAWHPLAAKRADLRQRIAIAEGDLVQVRMAAAQVEERRQAGVRGGADRAGRSLLALADASARDAGLGGALKRVEPVDGQAVRVSFEFASFDTLVSWLESLGSDYGIIAATLSADRADAPGLVHAQVLLNDAP